jgi:lipopolysaccharide transport system ATP-binding protein
MTKRVLEVNNLSKSYKLGLINTGSLVNDLGEYYRRLTKRGYNTGQIELSAKAKPAEESKKKYHQALNDVSFTLNEGDVLGVIGKNGAGKSTLLKILSRVTTPTSGEVRIYGRLASLLEVGTGFHPELTGRENVFMNGAILGMRKAEITKKFDEIIAFSGVGQYIDTPVKRYSSGMYVRLAFAVASHLEPEILIVDEVLAVGDSAFQKKCLDRMMEVSRSGRTVLFVSHNLSAVKQLCNRGLFLRSGTSIFEGDIDKALSLYYEDGVATDFSNPVRDIRPFARKECLGNLTISTITFNKASFVVGDNWEIEIKLENHKPGKEYKDLLLDFAIHDRYDNKLIHLTNIFLGADRLSFQPRDVYKFSIPSIDLSPDRYNLFMSLRANEEIEDWIGEPVQFDIIESNNYGFSNSSLIRGMSQPKAKFQVIQNA